MIASWRPLRLLRCGGIYEIHRDNRPLRLDDLTSPENGASGLAFTFGVFFAPAIATQVSEDTEGI
jgi:hypothetical protein